MAVEIERKFLLYENALPVLTDGVEMEQGYLPTQDSATVRVRIAGQDAYLTIKSKTENTSRLEFEYPIPLLDAQTMLNKLCVGSKIRKTRYYVPFTAHTWEIDVFHGDNQGLILAEVELDDPDEDVDLPPWVRQEVTEDPRYYNSNLRKNPYTHW